MNLEFKRVPAVDKCFNILDLFAKKKEPMGISEISNELGFNKSTVFNLVHTLTDLGVLETLNNKFTFGTKLYILGSAAEQGSDLIRNIHPYLQEISNKTNLSAFLGLRSGLKAIIVDKSDSSFDLKISSEIGTRIPLIAGAHGKAFLSLLTDKDLNGIISQKKLKRFTPYSCMNKEEYLEIIRKVREEGIAIENEEYLEGVRALAVPLKLKRNGLQTAIWAVGLKNQIKDDVISVYSQLLKDIAEKIESKF